MSAMPPVLADFGRQVETLRAVVLTLGEDAATPEEFSAVQDLVSLLKTVERLETGLHLLAMRGARSADLQGHLDSTNVGDLIWGRS